jgi:hypothetical protein
MTTSFALGISTVAGASLEIHEACPPAYTITIRVPGSDRPPAAGVYNVPGHPPGLEFMTESPDDQTR